MTAPEPHVDPEIVVVACATCNRPDSLARALASLEHLKTPDASEMVIVIIDNGAPEAGTEAQVHGCAGRVAVDVEYYCEEKPGIPHARNAMIDRAMARGARWLIMIDDDEAVTPDWAANLIAGMRAGGYALAGGPLRQELEAPAEGWIAKGIYATMTRDTEGMNARRARLAADGAFPGHVWTNNCAIDLEMVARTGIRFDVNFVRSGGSDKAFSLAVQKAGERIGWVPEAVVIEYLNANRLTLRFHVDLWRHLRLLNTVFEPTTRGQHLRYVAGHLRKMGAHLWAFNLQRLPLQMAKRYGSILGDLSAAFGRNTDRYTHGREHLR